MIVKSVLKLVWRFLKDEIWPHFWPIVKEQIAELIKSVFCWLKTQMVKKVDQATKERENEASRQASEEEHKAKAAKTHAEAEKHWAIAKVWREVAENFRRDNEELKTQLENLITDSHDELQGRLERINPELELEDPNKPKLRLGESTHILPALPLGNTDEEEKNKEQNHSGEAGKVSYNLPSRSTKGDYRIWGDGAQALRIGSQGSFDPSSAEIGDILSARLAREGYDLEDFVRAKEHDTETEDVYHGTVTKGEKEPVGSVWIAVLRDQSASQRILKK